MARHVKSERLKKLEREFIDLEQWLKLGLVPKKDVEKHVEEIATAKAKVEEEKERLRFLKESGDLEEYTAPKKQTGRTGYTEMPTIPDVEVGDTAADAQDSEFDLESETMETEASMLEERGENEEGQTVVEDKDEESYFSDRNRWRRGGIVDPDADEW